MLCGTPEVVADYTCMIGENPLWHPFEKRLLWTDIPTGRLFRYDPATGQHEQFYAGRPVGGFTIQRDGSLLLFKERGTITQWQSGQEITVVEQIPAELKLRFNDVIADPQGRVFCGTFTEGELGRLYRLDTDGTLTLLLDGIGCSNGMAFTTDRKTLFYTDSVQRAIYRFDYDEADGSIRNQRVFHQTAAEDGLPDGCTVDSDNCLWYAVWNGAALVRLDAEGKTLTRISIPATKTTSLAFAGDALDEIYVTTAAEPERSSADPLGGALFRVKSSVAGMPEFCSNVHPL